MTGSADAVGTLQRFFGRMAEATPVAWRHDRIFRRASIGAGVTLAVLLLHLIGPHAPELDRPTIHYDADTRTSWVGPPGATTPPRPTPPAAAEVPKIAPGQPLSSATVLSTPSTDHFGTFTPGKRP